MATMVRRVIRMSEGVETQNFSEISIGPFYGYDSDDLSNEPSYNRNNIENDEVGSRYCPAEYLSGRL